MKRSFLVPASCLALLLFLANTSNAQTPVKKPAAAAAPAAAGNTMAAVIAANSDLTTLVKVSNFVHFDQTLKSEGPYTFFAPLNLAFVNFTQAKLDVLAKNPAWLTATLKSHLVKGTYTKDDITKAMLATRSMTLTNLNGGTLNLSLNDQRSVEITDELGNKSVIAAFDTQGSNGLIHTVTGILQPKKPGVK